MPNTRHPQSSQNIFAPRQNAVVSRQSVQGVGQDKRAFASARSTSRQPAPDTKRLRAQPLKHKRIRSHINYTLGQKAEKVTVWVKPGVKAEIERIAAEQGLSVSATGAAFLEEAVRQKLHVHVIADVRIGQKRQDKNSPP